MSYYVRFLPALVSAAVFLAVGLLCFCLSQRALEHSRKELSWIKRHGAGGYAFDRRAFPGVKADWLGVFAVAVFALVTSMYCVVVHSLYLGGGGIRDQIAARSPLVLGFSWLGKLFTARALASIAVSVCGAVAMYLLLQRLCGSTMISACGALLSAASFVGKHTAGALLTVSLLLLVWWLNAPRKPRWSAYELLYYAACLALTAAIAIAPSLLVFALLYVGFYLHRYLFALRRDECSLGTLILCFALSLLVWALMLVVFAALRIFLSCGLSVRGFLALRRRFSVLRLFKLALGSGVRAAFRPLLRSRILVPALDAPLLGIGGFGAVSALLLLLRRKDARSKFVLPVLGAALLAWVLSDASVLSVPLTLCAALLFHNYLRGGRKLPVILLTVSGVLFYLVFYFLAHYLPLDASLLARLS